MGLKNIVILAVLLIIAVIAVLEWFLCIALSRSEKKRERVVPDEEQEESLKSLKMEKTSAEKAAADKKDPAVSEGKISAEKMQNAVLRDKNPDGGIEGTVSGRQTAASQDSKIEDMAGWESRTPAESTVPVRRKRRGFQHWQIVNIILILYDIIAVNAAYFLALWIRFDCRYTAIPDTYFRALIKFAPPYTLFCLAVFWTLRLYKSIWRFAGLSELLRTLSAAIITGIFQTAGITLFCRRMPFSYYIIGCLLQFLLVLGIRFAYRFFLLMRAYIHMEDREKPAKVMLIGAGAAGRMIMRDISSSKEINDRVVCIIDDNPNKWGRFIEGIPVEGGREDILLNVQKYRVDKIYIAIPTATAEQKRDILNICKETGCELKILPGIYQLVNDEVTVGTMKEVAIEDLLGREPIRIDMDEVYQFLSGKTVLVTGGGGSIGSELCRQIASHGPKQLIIFDVYENNAYDIQLELKDKYPELDLAVLIGSVRDSRRLEQVFAKYRPEIVYHAAAHKHVPLMEDSPCEAIKNNTIGTYKTAYAAMTHGCRRFVLISTDKAVNPTNIMGASKRLCEMLIQTFDRKIREGRVEDLPMLFTHASEGKEEPLDAVYYGEKRISAGAAAGGKKMISAEGEKVSERVRLTGKTVKREEMAAEMEKADTEVEKIAAGEYGLVYTEGLREAAAAQDEADQFSSQLMDGKEMPGGRSAAKRSTNRKIKKTDSIQQKPVLDLSGEAGNITAEKQNPCTEFVAVRFGNVLGSNGSVVPLFKRQIAKGGPVTVTHPDIIRYFMTIPEAVSLVLQAGTYAHGGEIFVLDMGCPVKIDTLARNLIKLSGYRPDVDIKVEYTGLRPGEKLYEEKLMAEEALKKSPNKWIHVGAPLKFDTDQFLLQLEDLMETAYGNQDGIRRKVAEIVETYHWEKAGK